MPLVCYEETYFTVKCTICNNVIGKVSARTLNRMFDDAPDPLLREWKIEMENIRSV